MKDFVGNELSIGDIVVFEQPNYRNFILGEITKKTPQKIHVKYFYQHNFHDFLILPNAVIKVNKKSEIQDKNSNLPCPCCGHEAKERTDLCQEGSEGTIYCSNCSLEITRWDDFSGGYALESARKIWNRRA
jgi:hypothetical protein